MSFRDDLDRASDWVDAYLARVGELPVAAALAPGAIRALLPEAPPEHGEPFETLLRDLDEVILPGLTRASSRGSRTRARSRESSPSS